MIKFRYVKFGGGKKAIYRPMINIGLKYKEKGTDVNYYVLVDSGADFNIFDWGIAEILGLKKKDGKEIEFSGVTGKKAKAFLYNVVLVVGGQDHIVKSAFSSDIASQNGIGVLGQKGFFDLYKVEFNYSKKVIKLKNKGE